MFSHSPSSNDTPTYRAHGTMTGNLLSAKTLGLLNIGSRMDRAGSDQLTGVCFILASALFSVLTTVLLKLNAGVLPLQIAYFRGIFAMVTAKVLALYCEVDVVPLGLQGHLFTLIFYRAFADCCSTLLHYFGCSELMLGLATITVCTSPFWALISGGLWLGEHYSVKDFFLVVLALFGVVLSATPSLSLSPCLANFMVIFLLILTSMFHAANFCFTKRLSRIDGVHIVHVLMSYGLCAIVMEPSMMVFKRVAEPSAATATIAQLENLSAMSLTLAIAFFATSAQVMLVFGVARVGTGVAALIRSADIPLALLLEHLLLHRWPTQSEALGGMFILMTCCALILQAHFDKHRLESECLATPIYVI